MGNYISLLRSETTGKVIFPDGRIHEFDTPPTVAELMLEYPQQAVIELKSAAPGTRITPLPADKLLEVRKFYLMVPIRRGKPLALSSQEAHQILLRANSVLRSSSTSFSSKLLALFSPCPASGEYGRRFAVGEGEKLAVAEGLGNEEKKADFDVTEGLVGGPDYLSRQLSGRRTWKPSLDSIREKDAEKRVSHWLFLRRKIVDKF
ncbi:hypothetical protein Nepgr_004161 [Nepenthes gracilis]|uniref:Uncharacterized protein n=1 Tax=Nepenthes gracilis TaxID=150966 RepID=A0AAD3XET5_NEPGR|nr:hypothetical protein Nepgr_004161 [Nepenthes gracilis]